MRLAFLIFRYFPFGGLQRNFLDIAQLCQKRGHEVFLFTGEWSGERPPDLDVTVLAPFGLSNHRQALRFVHATRPCVSQAKVDLVLGFNKMPGLDLYYAGDPCYVERIAKKYPSWETALLRLTPRYRSYQWLENEVFSPSSPTKILLLSEEERQSYEYHYETQKDRFQILPPGIVQPRLPPRVMNGESVRQSFRGLLGVEENQRAILFVGSAFLTKGLDRAIRAFASLPSHLQKYSRLVAIGDHRVQPFIRLTHRLKIADRVTFLPPRESVFELMQGADLLIHPSKGDVGGGVLLEAMAMGLPILTTGVCGYAKYVLQAGAGIVIPPPFQQEHLNGALCEMLTSLDENPWGKNGRAHAERHNYYQRNVRVVEIIEQTLKLKRC
jgi:UDP-glucose:(heptosyl)LPS alpha-1,3-glucosyltransferase